MPGDVKFGLLLAAGVVLFCGSKRISLQKDAEQAVAAVSKSMEKGGGLSSSPANLDVSLPSDLAKKADSASKEVATQVDDAAAKAKKSLDQGKKKSTDALAKLSPKDLREKVNQTKDQADEAIADLELPSELGGPASKSSDVAEGVSSTPKKSTGSSPSGVSRLPKASPKSEELPPVKTTDVSRVRDQSRGKGTSSLPKSPADEEFGSLDLPGDLTGNAPSRLSDAPSRLSESSGRPPGSSNSLPKGGSRSSGGEMEDFPKPLPDADRVAPTSGLKNVSSAGPVHPYFQRFLKEGSYFVREGESLREIAFNLYQDESRVGDILAANKEVLGSARDLKPGMKLRLP
jgi:nucleoid-associated protein YgaU